LQLALATDRRFTDEAEADTRAKMLIYLIENELIQLPIQQVASPTQSAG
jgi:hypothetical protein